MSEGQWKARGGEDGDQPHHHHHHPYEPHQLGPHYGTFPGVPSHQSPAMGFPQQVPLTGVTSHPPFPGPTYYPHGYQAVHGYVAVAEGRPLREPRLPCYGIGIGWLLFITGFFLAAIPWYVGAFILLCVRRVDYREKPGYVACTIGAFLAAIAIIVGATKGADIW